MTVLNTQNQSAICPFFDELLAFLPTPSAQQKKLLRFGLQALLVQFTTYASRVVLSPHLIDMMVAEIDASLSRQINLIMHHERFKNLESAWRGLSSLVERTDFTQNILIEFISISKNDLLDDFEDSLQIMSSGLYKHVYTAEYGQFGGKPIGLMIGNYEFTHKPQDIRLLNYVSNVAAMAHAPFIAGAGKEFFGIDSWENLPNLENLHAVFDMPQYAGWHTFRAMDEARYVALAVPQFLLRTPYDPETMPAKSFMFTEDATNVDFFCWGNTAFIFATRLTASFAQYRWCTNIIGPDGGGAVEHLPAYHFESMGQIQSKISTPVLISEHREFELAEEGFIALTIRKGADNAVFFSANSCQAAKHFAGTPAGHAAELNFKLSTQLPYMMIMNRLAHYIKVIQRENIGKWKERIDLERELNKWLSQYVTEMDSPDLQSRSKRPLRIGQIKVQGEANDPGWYTVTLLARPHFKYMGANFTLELTGKLDKK